MRYYASKNRTIPSSHKSAVSDFKLELKKMPYIHHLMPPENHMWAHRNKNAAEHVARQQRAQMREMGKISQRISDKAMKFIAESVPQHSTVKSTMSITANTPREETPNQQRITRQLSKSTKQEFDQTVRKQWNSIVSNISDSTEIDFKGFWGTSYTPKKMCKHCKTCTLNCQSDQKLPYANSATSPEVSNNHEKSTNNIDLPAKCQQSTCQQITHDNRFDTEHTISTTATNNRNASLAGQQSFTPHLSAQTPTTPSETTQDDDLATIFGIQFHANQTSLYNIDSGYDTTSVRPNTIVSDQSCFVDSDINTIFNDSHSIASTVDETQPSMIITKEIFDNSTLMQSNGETSTTPVTTGDHPNFTRGIEAIQDHNTSTAVASTTSQTKTMTWNLLQDNKKRKMQIHFNDNITGNSQDERSHTNIRSEVMMEQQQNLKHTVCSQCRQCGFNFVTEK